MPPRTLRGVWVGRPGRDLDVPLLWFALLPRGKRLCLCQRSRSGRRKAPFSVFASDFRGREKPAGLKGLAKAKRRSPHAPTGEDSQPTLWLFLHGVVAAPGRTRVCLRTAGAPHTPCTPTAHCRLGLRAGPFGRDSSSPRGVHPWYPLSGADDGA